MSLEHNCGVAAVYLKRPLGEYKFGGAANYLHLMLEQMQTRGRLSAGVVVYKEPGNKLVRHVGPGLVNQVFRMHEPEKHMELKQFLSSISGIGHLRYATSGDGIADEAVLKEAQPFLREHGKSWKNYGFAFNGNLTNYFDLRNELTNVHGYTVNTSVDTEVMMHFLAIDLKSLSENGKPRLSDLVRKAASRFDGAFSAVMVNGDGDLIAFRDRNGFRPLVWGENDNLIAVASESLALEKVGLTKFEDISSGGYLVVDKGKITKGVYSEPRRSHCMFEWVYFSADPSVIEGIPVDLVRERLGEELAKVEPLRGKFTKDYIVVPVPDTSIPIAHAMARQLGLEFVPAIYKNPSFGRGFINKQTERDRIMDGKYTIIRRRIESKKLIVVDDSVIRGDTFGRLANQLRENGALEIHLRSACPPIKHPCFYGIDFPSLEELMASGTTTIDEAEMIVKRNMELDSMKYLGLDELINAIGMDRRHLCLACLDGNYPTSGGREKFTSLRILK